MSNSCQPIIKSLNIRLVLFTVCIALPPMLVSCHKKAAGETDDSDSESDATKVTDSGSTDSRSNVAASETDTNASGTDQVVPDSETVFGDAFVSHPDPVYERCHTAFADAWLKRNQELWLGGYTSNGETACQGTIIQRFDGESWIPLETDQEIWEYGITSLCEKSSGELFAVSGSLADYTILLDGVIEPSAQIPAALIGDARITNLYCGEDDSVTAVGTDGLLLRFIDGEWSSEETDITVDLEDVTGSPRHELIVTGDQGVVKVLQNGNWTDIDIDQPASIQSLWISNTYDIYAASGNDGGGEPGRVMVYRDEQWTTLIEQPGDILLGVTGDNAGTVYAVGARRSEQGTARPVVWQITEAGQERAEIHDMNAFLWGVACVAPDNCYAYGTDNTFIEL